MRRIKKNDTIMIIKGKDRGKTGRVMKVLANEGKAIIEGRNLVKKHIRKTKADQQSGIIQIESPIQFSNIVPVCPKCDKPTRIGFSVQADNKKVRFCRKCKEVLA